MKKVLIIAQDNLCENTGGAITCTATLSNLLADHDYEVVCAYYSKISGKFDLLNNNVKLLNLYDKNERSFSDAVNLFVEQYHPDLIVFFYPHLYIHAALDKKFKDIPRILMFHSRPDWYLRRKRTQKKLEKLYINTTSTILFDSYIDLLPDFIRKGKVVTMPNAICSHKYVINLDIEHKKIVFFSRIDSYKGIEFLLKSFSLVVKKHPDWYLDLYGDIEPAEYKQELLELIKKLKLTNNVTFKGIIHNFKERLVQYDFAVFPSYFEGFGIGLLEMQSVGLPSVGLKGCSGVNELIKDGINGFLTKLSCKDYASKIEELIQNKELRKKFSINAKKEAIKYDSDVIDRKWISLIDQVINGEYLVHALIADKVAKKNFFSIRKIIKLGKKREKGQFYFFNKLIHHLFSISNKQSSKGKWYTIIYFLGIKFSFRNKKERIQGKVSYKSKA